MNALSANLRISAKCRLSRESCPWTLLIKLKELRLQLEQQHCKAFTVYFVRRKKKLQKTCSFGEEVDIGGGGGEGGGSEYRNAAKKFGKCERA